MKSNIVKRLHDIKFIIIIVLFLVLLRYESPKELRLYIFLGVFIGFLVLEVYKTFGKDEWLHCIISVVQIILITIVGYFSKYIIHLALEIIIQTMVIIECALIYRKIKYIGIVGMTMILGTVITAFDTASYQISYSMLMELTFYIIIAIIIALSSLFVTYLLKGKEQIEALNQEIERLTIEEERNRISKELHDELGHMMTGLIMQLEMADAYLPEHVDHAKKIIKDAKSHAREGLKTTRKVVENLSVETNVVNGLVGISTLVENFSKQTGAEILFIFKNNLTPWIPEKFDLFIYRMIQEGLTNAIRHGGATKIYVKAYYDKKEYRIDLLDNGRGININTLSKGFGLKSMEKRLEKLNGKISYVSEDGFHISVTIPLEGVMK